MTFSNPEKQAKFNRAMDQFTRWLPGELRYSVEKGGYDKKVERARKAPADPQSIRGFLGQEWHSFRSALTDEFYYAPDHRKSAQLQAAKFAAGIFDKVALEEWLMSGSDATLRSFRKVATDTADAVFSLRPWQRQQLPDGLHDAKIEDTPFDAGIIEIMRDVQAIANAPSAEMRRDYGIDAQLRAIELGGLAARSYGVFAVEYLTDDQFVLPQSVHSDTFAAELKEREAREAQVA